MIKGTEMNKPDDSTPSQPQPPAEQQAPRLRDIVRSVLSAAIGIQSSKNQERDFKHGKAKVFIIAGIVYTLIFITVVVTIVRLVLKNAGY